jgi:hypothetical protein
VFALTPMSFFFLLIMHVGSDWDLFCRLCVAAPDSSFDVPIGGSTNAGPATTTPERQRVRDITPSEPVTGTDLDPTRVGLDERNRRFVAEHPKLGMCCILSDRFNNVMTWHRQPPPGNSRLHNEYGPKVGRGYGLFWSTAGQWERTPRAVCCVLFRTCELANQILCTVSRRL